MTLKTSRWVKVASDRRPHSIWFHGYKMSKIGRSIDTESRLVVASAEMWVIVNGHGVFGGVIKYSKLTL